jgi:DNA helicase-2/ATP-dependent DNA helicase PcrA
MFVGLIRQDASVALNPTQQSAVEHGVGAADRAGPLLVIAGAGSGKTAMFALVSRR